MLILTRRVGETLVIEFTRGIDRATGKERKETVKVSVLGAKPDEGVKIGIDAPRYMRVYRDEIHKRITKERAAGQAAEDLFNKGGDKDG